MRPRFFLSEIEDEYIRENFKTIQEVLSRATLLKGEFKHFDLSLKNAVTNFRFPHSLGYMPKDLIMTFRRGSGDITWHYDRFNGQFIELTTTGPVEVRFFLGRYSER